MTDWCNWSQHSKLELVNVEAKKALHSTAQHCDGLLDSVNTNVKVTFQRYVCAHFPFISTSIN